MEHFGRAARSRYIVMGRVPATLQIGVLLALLLAAPAAVVRGVPAPAQVRCGELGTAIHVATREHRLTLCEVGRVAGTYPVTLGAGGVGKRKEGDGRTPLGRYPLRAPRASNDFGLFIGIGYPTPDQRARGYTGSAIGIHGPPRALTKLKLRLSDAALAMDWTRGCIAVATDREIEAIAAWVVRAHAREVVIE